MFSICPVTYNTGKLKYAQQLSCVSDWFSVDLSHFGISIALLLYPIICIPLQVKTIYGGAE